MKNMSNQSIESLKPTFKPTSEMLVANTGWGPITGVKTADGENLIKPVSLETQVQPDVKVDAIRPIAPQA